MMAALQMAKYVKEKAAADLQCLKAKKAQEKSKAEQLHAQLSQRQMKS